MKINIFAFLLLITSFAANAGWVEGTTIGVRDDNPKIPVVLFINTYTNTGDTPDTWHQINVNSLGVPSDAISVGLGGVGIITHGTTAELCEITVTFRAPGNSLNIGDYIIQVIEPHLNGGERQTAFVQTPVVNGYIEYSWHRATTGEWPDHCSYGMNLAIQNYIR